MINRRFLNYKHYQSFLNDLNNGQILRDAIVFIQDESHPCIWTHGKEYICNVGKSYLNSGKLVFDDGLGNSLFAIEQEDGTITITDSEGNSSSSTYVLQNTFTRALRDIDNSQLKENNFKTITTQKGQNISLIGDGTIDATVNIDNQLDNASEQPVQNNVITAEFGKKQNKLVEGSGISIVHRNDGTEEISSTLDVEPFVILTQDEFPPANPSANKVYVVVENDGGETRYMQYIYRNSEWVPTSGLAPQIDLSPYLTSAEAAELYQPTGDYVTNTSLRNYTQINVIPLFNNYYTKTQISSILNDFATKQWSDDRYVKKVDVYTPDQNDYPGEEEPVSPTDPTSNIGGDGYRHVFLTQGQYDQILLYDENTIYFIYESDDQSSDWHFGDSFPIILT